MHWLSLALDAAALRIPLRARPTGADTVIPSHGPPGSTGRPTLVLRKVQTRSHKEESDHHKPKYRCIGYHKGLTTRLAIDRCLAPAFFLSPPRVIVFQCHDMAHLFQFFGALLEAGPHDVTGGKHSDDLPLALDE